MKYIIMAWLAISAAAFAFLARAEDTGTPVDTSACEKSDECVIEEDACYGFYSAINRRFSELHEEKMKKIRPLIDCLPPAQTQPPKVLPYCKNGHCEY